MSAAVHTLPDSKPSQPLRTQPSTARSARALGVPKRGITLQKGVAFR